MCICVSEWILCECNEYSIQNITKNDNYEQLIVLKVIIMLLVYWVFMEEASYALCYKFNTKQMKFWHSYFYSLPVESV
jgi:transposase